MLICFEAFSFAADDDAAVEPPFFVDVDPVPLADLSRLLFSFF